MIAYGFTKELDRPYEEVVELATKALQKEGFGILTTIDVREKLKEKLGIDFMKYIILGACNPSYAHQALVAEGDIGLLLPCNVVVYEKGAKTTFSIIKPSAAMAMVENKGLTEIAKVVETLLEKVFHAVG